jgi:hypothetical protein
MIILLSVLGTLAAQMLIWVLLPKVTIYYFVIGGLTFLISKSMVIAIAMLIPAFFVVRFMTRKVRANRIRQELDARQVVDDALNPL